MQPESSKNIGPMCGDGETCEPSLQNLPMNGDAISSAEDSLVRTSVPLVGGSELKANEVDYGLNIRESFARYDHVTSSWRTSQACWIEGWEKFSESWPKAGTMRSGVVYRHPSSVPITRGNGYTFWPTPSKSNAAMYLIRRQTRVSSSGSISITGARSGIGGSASLSDVAWIVFGEPLRPEFSEWLMGFPIAWSLVLDVSETQSFPKLLNGSESES